MIEEKALVKCPPPGVYYDVPEADYFSWDAASSSTLKHMDASPRRARFKMRTWDTSRSPFRDFGHAAHCAVFEPDELERRYCAKPVVINPKTGNPWGPTAKAVEEAIASLEAEGKIVVGSHNGIDIMEAALAFRTYVRRSPSAARLLDVIEAAEVSIVADDPITGVPVKCRTDGLTIGAGIIAELKTTKDSFKPAFRRDATRYGYHNQAQFYLSVARWAGLQIPHHIIIAIDSAPPWDCRTFVLPPSALARADEENRRRLDRFAECWVEDDWPGPESEDPEPLDIARWGYYDQED